MGYRINRTDGELLVDLIDGIIDTTTVDLTLIGKNYKGFGELVNENFIKLLENFSSTTQPANPMIGQLWYDKQDQRLKLYDGTSFRSAAGTIINSTAPTNLTAGDLWIDNKNNKLYIYDGSDLTLVGPNYDASQQKTGYEAASVIDATDIQRTILKFFMGGILVGIFATETFYIPVQYALAGVSIDPTDTNVPQRQKLYKGFNLARPELETGTDGFWYRGTALKAKSLIDDAGVTRTPAEFLPSNTNGITTGSIKVKNSNGITVGVGDNEYTSLIVTGSTSVLKNLQADSDFAIQVRRGNSVVNSFYIDASASNLGILTTAPTSTLDVNGDVRVRGRLNVEGEAFYISSTTLRVSDLNIELGLGEDSTLLDEVYVDGAGITVASKGGSKDWFWNYFTNSWTSNLPINIITSDTNSSPSYGIDGVPLLTKTEIHSSVTRATGLTRVGTLSLLDVGSMNFTNTTITSSGAGFDINASNNNNINITSNNTRITGVDNPIANQDVATKYYVDTEISGKELYFTFNVTGEVDPNDPASTISRLKVQNLIQSMVLASAVKVGTVAKVMAESMHNTSATGLNLTVVESGSGLTGSLVKSFIAVTNSTNTGTESVVKDIASGGALQGNITVVVNRWVYTYTSNGSIWNYNSYTAVIP